MSLWKGGSSSVTLKGTQRSGASAASGKRARNPAGPRKGGWGAEGPGPGSGRGPELKSLQEGREQCESHAHLGREGRRRRLPLAHRPVALKADVVAPGRGVERGGVSRGGGQMVGRGRKEGGVGLRPPTPAPTLCTHLAFAPGKCANCAFCVAALLGPSFPRLR